MSGANPPAPRRGSISLMSLTWRKVMVTASPRASAAVISSKAASRLPANARNLFMATPWFAVIQSQI